jgi:hypothetical protein
MVVEVRLARTHTLVPAHAAVVTFQLEDPIDEQTYLDGGPYDDSWKTPATVVPVLKPFRPPAPAKAVNPLASRVAARSASPVIEPHPSPLDTARFALPPAAVPALAKFKSPAFVKQPVVQTTPLKEQAKKGGPRFDPEREGAVVMRRPDEQHQRQYNTKWVRVELRLLLRSRLPR